MNQHLISLQEELGLSFYNGGWIKSVTGLDKSHDNGYSIQGDFIGQGVRPLTPGLYLVCDISGSRKNNVKTYHLVEVTEAGEVVDTATADGTSGYNRGKTGHDWAVRLWPAIDAYFAREKPGEPTRLSVLIAELAAIGEEKGVFFSPSLTDELARFAAAVEEKEAAE